jgi:hypothetical protein
MAVLALCIACSRHVRSDEPACPFCGAPPPFAVRARPPTGARRLTRVAAFSLGASLGAAGCNHDALPIGNPDAAADAAAAVIDLAIADESVVDAARGDGPRDGGGDLRTADAAVGPDLSSIPIYSAPPPRDAD